MNMTRYAHSSVLAACVRYLLIAWTIVAATMWFAEQSAANATNFQLGDFIEIEKSSVESLVPQLTEKFPQAKFLLSGFSSPVGDWKLIRVEDSDACEAEFCPTVLALSSSEWTVYVSASKEIHISVSLEGSAFVQCNLKMKDGRTLSIRYSTANKIIYVAP